MRITFEIDRPNPAARAALRFGQLATRIASPQQAPQDAEMHASVRGGFVAFTMDNGGPYADDRRMNTSLEFLAATIRKVHGCDYSHTFPLKGEESTE